MPISPPTTPRSKPKPPSTKKKSKPPPIGPPPSKLNENNSNSSNDSRDTSGVNGNAKTTTGKSVSAAQQWRSSQRLEKERRSGGRKSEEMSIQTDHGNGNGNGNGNISDIPNPIMKTINVTSLDENRRSPKHKEIRRMGGNDNTSNNYNNDDYDSASRSNNPHYRNERERERKIEQDIMNHSPSNPQDLVNNPKMRSHNRTYGDVDRGRIKSGEQERERSRERRRRDRRENSGDDYDDDDDDDDEDDYEDRSRRSSTSRSNRDTRRYGDDDDDDEEEFKNEDDHRYRDRRNSQSTHSNGRRNSQPTYSNNDDDGYKNRRSNHDRNRNDEYDRENEPRSSTHRRPSANYTDRGRSMSVNNQDNIVRPNNSSRKEEQNEKAKFKLSSDRHRNSISHPNERRGSVGTVSAMTASPDISSQSSSNTGSKIEKDKLSTHSSSSSFTANELQIYRKKLRAISLHPRLHDNFSTPLVLRSLHEYILNPVPVIGTQIRCYIERSQPLFNRLLSPLVGGTNTAGNLVYALYADHSNGSGRLLLYARKMKVWSKGVRYVISSKREDLFVKRGERSKHYLGKLKGNGAGTEYVLFDSGVDERAGYGFGGESDSEDSGGEDDGYDHGGEEEKEDVRKSSIISERDKDKAALRKELCVISYDHNNDVNEETRKMEVCIPHVHDNDDMIKAVIEDRVPTANESKPQSITTYVQSMASSSSSPSSSDKKQNQQTLKSTFNRIMYQKSQNLLSAQKTHVFHMRVSKYDKLSSCLVDFKDRANCSSVKNFQVIKSWPADAAKKERWSTESDHSAEDRSTESDGATHPVLLQMGKVGKHCFNMDVQYPFSLLQAFGVCLSRFDTAAEG